MRWSLTSVSAGTRRAGTATIARPAGSSEYRHRRCCRLSRFFWTPRLSRPVQCATRGVGRTPATGALSVWSQQPSPVSERVVTTLPLRCTRDDAHGAHRLHTEVGPNVRVATRQLSRPGEGYVVISVSDHAIASPVSHHTGVVFARPPPRSSRIRQAPAHPEQY
jgi:hypothetical protein